MSTKLSRTQAAALAYIRGNPECSVPEVGYALCAERFIRSSSCARALVTALIAAGLVERMRVPGLRAYALIATPAGKRTP